MKQAFSVVLGARSPQMIEPAKLDKALSQMGPKSVKINFITPLDAEADVIMLNLSEMTISLRLMPTPIPEPVVKGAVATDKRHQVSQELFQNDTAHIHLSVVSGVYDHASALDAAKVLTTVAVATAKALSLSHGIWMTGKRVWVAEDFQRAEGTDGSGELPISLWANFQFFRGSGSAKNDPEIGGFTIGLEPFVGREIEMEPVLGNQQQLMMFVVALAKWVVNDGLFMKSGDTLDGKTNDFRLVFQDSGSRVPAPVIQIEPVGALNR